MIMAVRPVVPAGLHVDAAKTGVMVRAVSVRRTGIVMANAFLMKRRVEAPDLSLRLIHGYNCPSLDSHMTIQSRIWEIGF